MVRTRLRIPRQLRPRRIRKFPARWQNSAAEIGPENSRIVGIQCDRNARIQQSPDRVSFERFHGASPHIACNADFQWDTFLAQTPHQIRIFHRANAMSDAFRADIECRADGIGPICFARMGGQMKSGVFRILVCITKLRSLAADLIAAHTE